MEDWDHEGDADCEEGEEEEEEEEAIFWQVGHEAFMELHLGGEDLPGGVQPQQGQRTLLPLKHADYCREETGVARWPIVR